MPKKKKRHLEAVKSDDKKKKWLTNHPSVKKNSRDLFSSKKPKQTTQIRASA